MNDVGSVEHLRILGLAVMVLEVLLLASYWQFSRRSDRHLERFVEQHGEASPGVFRAAGMATAVTGRSLTGSAAIEYARLLRARRWRGAALLLAMIMAPVVAGALALLSWPR